MNEKGFFIKFYGDSSVGISSNEWIVVGDFYFSDLEEKSQFVEELKEAWEYASDTPISIETLSSNIDILAIKEAANLTQKHGPLPELVERLEMALDRGDDYHERLIDLEKQNKELRDKAEKLTAAVKKHHPTVQIPEQEDLYLALHDLLKAIQITK